MVKTGTTRPPASVHWLAVAGCLALSTVLAATSLLGDSVTFDETIHLVAGASHLQTGDFRFASDHPPLARMWAAIPLRFIEHAAVPVERPEWTRGDWETIGRAWLFELNDGERLIVAPRLMMVLVLLATCLATYGATRVLFGRRAALLALFVCSLSPTVLAHGRLVTNDLPMALFAMLTLLAYDRFLVRMSVPRLLGVAASASALALTKLAWPLLLPALAVMGVVAIARREPITCGERSIAPRGRRLLAVAASAAVISGIVWGAVWAGYGFRFSPFRGPDHDRATLMTSREEQGTTTTMALAWDSVTRDHAGERMTGPVVAAVGFARAHRLLPEAYLYAIVRTKKRTLARTSYLLGEIADGGGFLWYFPIAFAIKTPVGTLVLALAGLAAVIARRAPARAPALLTGLAVFFVVYAAAVIASRVNIGHRHLAPLYPIVFVAAGAATGWLSIRGARWMMAALCTWLVAATLWIHPHYISYFNELIGGPGRGHRYLIGSNLDWGQDLKRLARFAREHDGIIHLAYHGTAMPERYGFEVTDVASTYAFAPPSSFTEGTYVISATIEAGLYGIFARDRFWESQTNRDMFRKLEALVREPLPPTATAEERERSARRLASYRTARAGLLLRALRGREPDERIGYSLSVYHLSDEELAPMLSPPDR